MSDVKNPYGRRPGGGISLPDYYQPWETINNRNMFLPGTEILPEHEMRITFLGSSPWPPNELQNDTSMLVELGNGAMQQEQFVRDLEIDPALYYPADALRPQTQTWPGVTINPREMLAQRGIEVDPDWVQK